ncbi:MAG: DegT/DnrJ/EryC1/StrS family aminotransferase [Cryomorphaceae bacterium]|nr:DegT/DnrJ/EryC1/StrS family aminotransferase [Cryomorphaceae bacterium]
MSEKIWLSSPHMGPNERRFVEEAFDTNWIAPLGPHVNGFEADLQSYVGVGQAAALSSGTAALHLGLILLGVKEGDYVICQSMTFSASANPIVYQGAIPVFVDSEFDTWNMCPAALEDAIKAGINGTLTNKNGDKLPARKPKAIIPVHLYGMPAKMDAITAIGDKYNIPILEDAAEALGSHINGKRCGAFGQLGVLSFNGNKIITTSGGGALLSNDESIIEKARFLATQARDQAPHYQHSHIGYNYRMSNVLAGIGRGQMQVLDERVASRRSNYEQYRSFFAAIDGVNGIDEPNGYFSNRWLSTFTIDPNKTKGITREDVRLALEKENIEARPLWKPMHMQPVFENAPYFGGTVAEELFENGLCFPSGSNLNEADFKRIFTVLEQIFSH